MAMLTRENRKEIKLLILETIKELFKDNGESVESSAFEGGLVKTIDLTGLLYDLDQEIIRVSKH